MTWLDFIANFGAVIGYGIIGSGALVGFAYWIFKLFTEKWLTAKFNERLESYKHEQQKELEQLRFKIGALMDRTVKLHQREFEVLPEAWSLMASAYAVVKSVTIGLQSFADVDRMDESELSGFLKTSLLSDEAQRKIRESGNRSKIYRAEEQWRRKNIAMDELFKFADHLRRNGVFVRPMIKEKFISMRDMLHGAIVEHELRLQHPDERFGRDATTKLLKEGEKFHADIENLVQDILWDSQATLSSEVTATNSASS
jgi:hypothetical protein